MKRKEYEKKGMELVGEIFAAAVAEKDLGPFEDTLSLQINAGIATRDQSHREMLRKELPHADRLHKAIDAFWQLKADFPHFNSKYNPDKFFS